MPRLPTLADFPSSLTLTITPPPLPTPQPTHVLLLLHGLGDTHLPFTSLARTLSLPATACISLRAPTPLPFDIGGFHWGDDITFDGGAGGQMDLDTGFARAMEVVLDKVVLGVLVGKCGFRSEEVVVFGFGQGGMVGLAIARQLQLQVQMDAGLLGGVISIGGPLPEGFRMKSDGKEKCKTAVLVLGGAARSAVTVSAAQRIKEAFADAQFVKWQKHGDGMPRSREEMLPIMQFFAQRLRSRAPEGMVEVG